MGKGYRWQIKFQLEHQIVAFLQVNKASSTHPLASILLCLFTIIYDLQILIDFFEHALRVSPFHCSGSKLRTISFLWSCHTNVRGRGFSKFFC